MMGASQVDAKMDRTLKSNPSLPPISYSEVASQVDENGSHIEVACLRYLSGSAPFVTMVRGHVWSRYIVHR
jgi:hypothetical protein